MLDNYSSTLTWLFQQFPSYQQLGAAAYKPGLDNTRKLLASLGNPENSLRFIHVAGTNGKGSTCAFMASFLQQSGYRAGLFTSPHLIDFRERIRVNGKPISEESVVAFTEKIQTQKADYSFFEITLAMALVHFQQESCDFVVLETGMGGRLDATNVVTPLLSIITQIGLDHQVFLGETLPEIAAEKAGIIKARIPVLCGEERITLQTIFQSRSQALDAPIQFVTQSHDASTQLLPTYQCKNAALALEAMKTLGLSIQHLNPFITWQNLFVETGFLGRLTPSKHHLQVWYDAAHNAEGLQATMQALEGFGVRELIVVFGASNDKPLAHLAKFRYQVAAWVFSAFSNPRSYRVDELRTQTEGLNLPQRYFAPEVNEALEMALTMRKENQGILVTGSFFLLSDCQEIRELLQP